MDSTFWQVALLAIIQGVTEFLPISSSGHLVIVSSFLKTESGEGIEIADLSIVLHLGTLLSIVVFYFKKIRDLLFEDRRVIWLLIIGTIPVVLVGLPVKLLFDHLLESRLLAGILLIVTGVMLVAIARFPVKEGKYQDLPWTKALFIGLCQSIAILPGLSRSGTTITAGLGCGLSPRAAATFSFLLAIPAIAGAGVLEALQIIKDGPGNMPPSHLAGGFAIAFVVGLASLWWLLRWIEKGRLHWFALWCIPLGVVIIAMEVL